MAKIVRGFIAGGLYLRSHRFCPLCVPHMLMNVFWPDTSPLWHPSGGPAIETSCWSKAMSPCGPATSQTGWDCCSGWAGAVTWGSCRCPGTPWSSSWTWVGGYSAEVRERVQGDGQTSNKLRTLSLLR